MVPRQRRPGWLLSKCLLERCGACPLLHLHPPPPPLQPPPHAPTTHTDESQRAPSAPHTERPGATTGAYGGHKICATTPYDCWPYGGAWCNAIYKRAIEDADPNWSSHAVVRDGKCREGVNNAKCGVAADCIRFEGLSEGKCIDDRCEDGRWGAMCNNGGDCIQPEGLSDGGVCRECSQTIPARVYCCDDETRSKVPRWLLRPNGRNRLVRRRLHAESPEPPTQTATASRTNHRIRGTPVALARNSLIRPATSSVLRSTTAMDGLLSVPLPGDTSGLGIAITSATAG